jgi:hypothetical protein
MQGTSGGFLKQLQFKSISTSKLQQYMIEKIHKQNKEPLKRLNRDL